MFLQSNEEISNKTLTADSNYKKYLNNLSNINSRNQSKKKLISSGRNSFLYFQVGTQKTMKNKMNKIKGKIIANNLSLKTRMNSKLANININDESKKHVVLLTEQATPHYRAIKTNRLKTPQITQKNIIDKNKGVKVDKNLELYDKNIFMTEKKDNSNLMKIKNIKSNFFNSNLNYNISFYRNTQNYKCLPKDENHPTDKNYNEANQTKYLNEKINNISYKINSHLKKTKSLKKNVNIDRQKTHDLHNEPNKNEYIIKKERDSKNNIINISKELEKEKQNQNISRFNNLKNITETNSFYNTLNIQENVTKIKNQSVIYQPSTDKKESNIVIKDNIGDMFLLLLEKLNIFNSILILLNYINFTENEMEKLNTSKTFEKNRKRYGLSFILYQLNRYSHNYSKKYKTTQEELKSNYEMYIKQLLIKSNNDSTLEEYLNNIDNAKFIIEYIFKKINKELREFSTEYPQKCSSFILDNFLGIIEKQQLQNNCPISCNCYNFFDFDFNLDQIAEINILENDLKILDLNDCFKKMFLQQNNDTKIKTCSFPNILTIVLKSYTFTRIDFHYPDELNLNEILYLFPNSQENYKVNKDDVYVLVGMLCKYSFSENSFVCYYINPKDEIWYYRKNRNNSHKVTDFSMNLMPIILFYQKKNTISFEYKNLRRSFKYFYLFFEDMRGYRKRLYVRKDSLVFDTFKLLTYDNPYDKISFLFANGHQIDKMKTFEQNHVKEGNTIVVTYNKNNKQW